MARGNVYSGEAPAAALEHLETYLRGVFNFLGIEPEFVVAEGLAISPEHRETAIRQALGDTIRLAAWPWRQPHSAPPAGGPSGAAPAGHIALVGES